MGNKLQQTVAVSGLLTLVSWLKLTNSRDNFIDISQYDFFEMSFPSFSNGY